MLEASTFWELLDRRASEMPDALMFTDENDRRVTFGEFRDRAERVASGLQSQFGVGPGSVVSWQLPTRIETVLASMALARLGAVQNPIIHIYREREVGFAIRQLQSELFLVPGVWRDFDYAAMGERLGVPTLVAYDELPEGDPSSLPPPPSDGDALRWIYYTSGTTADPKGVQHTDQTLIAGGKGLAVALDMSTDDVGTIAFPFAHIGGPDYFVTQLMVGFPIVLLETFVPDQAVEILRRNGATMAGGSTAFYIAFVNEQRKNPDQPIIPTLRVLSGGGAPKPPEVFYEVQRELRCRGTLHGYGMTESPMITQGSPHDTDEQLANTEGAPVLGAEVRLVPETGEVCVRGPMVCKGYTDPELTKQAFDDDGFFHTGDVGVLRDDGHVTLTGRVKDIIIRKGENISAKEVEDLLYQHPKVGDVAVIGLPDRDRGELVCAVVETSPGQSPLAFVEMQDYLREAGLMTQKIPERLEVVDQLPRNATFKVLKYQLREQFA